jgi:hypothetical protein
VCGDGHAPKAAPSTRHSKVDGVSLEPKPKVGVVFALGSAGCEVIEVSGGPVTLSTVTLRVAVAVWPTLSTTVARSTFGPSGADEVSQETE